MPDGLQAEIVAIGDELTTGQRLDTNSKWLAERLTELGVQTLYHTTVADDLEANLSAFRTAAERVDVVVMTGGLGPTADDLTRDALAELAEVELLDNPEVLEHIKSLFAARGREMTHNNALQARFPKGAHPIPNSSGTAPGIDFTIQSSEGQIGKGQIGKGMSCRFFALPGVPSEMRPMWSETVGPAIQKLAPGRVTRHYLVKCYGVGESQLEVMLHDMIARKREPLVGITASQTTLTLRVTASGADDAECAKAMAPTLATIRETLGDLIFAEAPGGGKEPDLEDALVAMLRERGESLATAEAMTGGELARRLGVLDSAGQVLLNAEVSPRDRAKDEAEQVKQDALRRRIKQGVDWSLAIGAADGAQDVQVALSSDSTTKSFRVPLYGPAEHHRSRVAKQALNLLRLAMLHKEKDQHEAHSA